MTEEWAVAHAQFHAALVDGCGSPLLCDIRRSLYEAAELYRRWSDSGELDRDVAGEHRAIMEAALARNADRTVTLLVDHIRNTARILLESI